jgi:hypothetical protein
MPTNEMSMAQLNFFTSFPLVDFHLTPASHLIQNKLFKFRPVERVFLLAARAKPDATNRIWPVRHRLRTAAGEWQTPASAAPTRGCVKSLSLVETFTPVCGLYQA